MRSATELPQEFTHHLISPQQALCLIVRSLTFGAVLVVASSLDFHCTTSHKGHARIIAWFEAHASESSHAVSRQAQERSVQC